MGMLKDRAREKSPYIALEIGEETDVLVYKAWKEAVDHFGNDTFRYVFEMETETGSFSKQLDNGGLSFAEAMDAIPFGSKVILSRDPKKDKSGNLIPNKSTWTVRIV